MGLKGVSKWWKEVSLLKLGLPKSIDELSYSILKKVINDRSIKKFKRSLVGSYSFENLFP